MGQHYEQEFCQFMLLFSSTLTIFKVNAHPNPEPNASPGVGTGVQRIGMLLEPRTDYRSLGYIFLYRCIYIRAHTCI